MILRFIALMSLEYAIFDSCPYVIWNCAFPRDIIQQWHGVSRKFACQLLFLFSRKYRDEKRSQITAHLLNKRDKWVSVANIRLQIFANVSLWKIMMNVYIWSSFIISFIILFFICSHRARTIYHSFCPFNLEISIYRVWLKSWRGKLIWSHLHF